jgi:hypothetical protein
MSSEWRELSAEQRRIMVDATQLYEHYLDLRQQSREVRGGMFWKKVKGKDYLVRSIDRLGHVRSLGPRSRSTEAIFREFGNKKKDLRNRLGSAADELRRRAKFCVAAAVNRVPTLPANVIRVLDSSGLLGPHLFVLGSHALYAYEAAAGVHLKEGLLQTNDLDTVIDMSAGLELGEPIRTKGFLGLLGSVDKTFRLAGKRSFRAVNAKGFMVDLLRPTGEGAATTYLPSIGLGKDLIADQLEGLQWLSVIPKISQIVIAGDGFPLRMVVPDARVYALHKLWVSLRPDRDPIKRKRDFRQGEIVGRLAIEYLNLSFDDSEVKRLPVELTRTIPGLLRRFRARGKGTASKTPPGFSADPEVSSQ